MSKYIYRILILVIVSFFCSLVFADNATNPSGYWNTVDDKTGQVLSVVYIYPTPGPNGALEGKIVKIYPILGQKVTDKCTKCEGALNNQPILGMTIITNMVQIADNKWGKGKVLDPKSGNVYSGNMTVINDGKQLNLHGYVGIPLFGRTETWNRTSKP